MTISEERLKQELRSRLTKGCFEFVTGPGRSGAIAAVYASHIFKINFIPFGATVPHKELLIIDTAAMSGRTLRKAFRRYEHLNPTCLALFNEPPRVKFWYETF
jgi:hypothetical protein